MDIATFYQFYFAIFYQFYIDIYIKLTSINFLFIYCNLKNIDGTPTCRNKGANENYKKNLENTPALLLYRRTYQQKVMNVYRNKNDKQLKKSFDEWKKEAQTKIKLFKKGKLDEDTLYKWMVENK